MPLPGRSRCLSLELAVVADVVGDVEPIVIMMMMMIAVAAVVVDDADVVAVVVVVEFGAGEPAAVV